MKVGLPKPFEFVSWAGTIINSILNLDNERKRLQPKNNKMRLEVADYIEFESTLQPGVEELNLKLKESDNLRESDILINEIDTLESILDRFADLKYGNRICYGDCRSQPRYSTSNPVEKEIN